MHKRSKLLLAGLTAALFMSLAVGAASAQRLSINERNFRIVWTPLSLQAPAVEATIRCNVTLEGSFHSNTITKTSRSLVGYINRAGLLPASCVGGSATVLTATLPWHVQYESFRGTLPAITSVNLLLIGASFRVDPTSALVPACLARTSATTPARGIGNINSATGVVNNLEADGSAGIPLSEGFGCSLFTGFFSGAGVATTRGGGSLVIRLI